MKWLLFITTSLSLCVNSFAEELTTKKKEEIVKEIFQRINQVTGTNRKPPVLLFDTINSNNVSYLLNSDENTTSIGFELKAFDVCAGFEKRRDDAIALLLSNEIAKYHLGKWDSLSINSFSYNLLAQSDVDINKLEIIDYELLVNKKSRMLCYLAGYNGIRIGEQLITNLYTSYNIKSSNVLPSLQERISTATEADEKIYTLIGILETGDYALMLADYKLAIDCYSHVINSDFVSQEIYNNLGIAYFSKGVEVKGSNNVKYVYPVEINLDSRLNHLDSEGSDDVARQNFKYAKKMFYNSTQFDENFAFGYLYSACCSIVLGDLRTGEALARRAIMNTDQSSKGVSLHANLLLTIIKSSSSKIDKTEIERGFDRLISENHVLSWLNKEIYAGKSLKEINISGLPLSWMDGSHLKGATSAKTKEAIFGLEKYTDSEIEKASLKSISERIGNGKELWLHDFPTSKLTKVETGFGKKVAFHKIKENNTNPLSLEVKVGSSYDMTLGKYGMPSIVLSTNRGEHLFYPDCQLIISMSRERKVQSWMIWRDVK